MNHFENNFIRKKDKTHLWAKIKIPIHQIYYAFVYIWGNREAMYQNSDTDFDRDFDAICLNNGYKYDIDTYVVSSPNLLSEIHLVLGVFGSGVVAHEFQHALLNWWNLHTFANHPVPGVVNIAINKSEDELFCEVTGKVISKFWKDYYARRESDYQ